MKYIITRAVMTFGLVLGLTTVARADLSLSLNPVADALLSAANPNSNYGGAGALEISAAGSKNGEFQSLMRFDLAAIKSGFDAAFGAGNWTVTAVTLRLNEANPAPLPGFFNPSAAGQIGVTWMANSAWIEGTGSPMNPGATGVNFNSLPALISASDQSIGSFSFDGKTNGGATFYPLTVASGFLGDVQLGNLTGFRLSALDSTVSGLFTSTNNSTFPPLLTITAAAAIPEPSSLAFVGIAAFTGIWLRRRRSLIPRSKDLVPG